MKILKGVLTILVGFGLLINISCGGKNNDPMPTDETIDLFDGMWAMSSVTHNVEGDLSSYYPGFTISFTVSDQKEGGNYTVNNGVVWFGTSGSWTFNEGTTSNEVELENGLKIETDISETELTLIFTVSSRSERSDGIGGTYTVVFTK